MRGKHKEYDTSLLNNHKSLGNAVHDFRKQKCGRPSNRTVFSFRSWKWLQTHTMGVPLRLTTSCLQITMATVPARMVTPLKMMGLNQVALPLSPSSAPLIGVPVRLAKEVRKKPTPMQMLHMIVYDSCTMGLYDYTVRGMRGNAMKVISQLRLGVKKE